MENISFTSSPDSSRFELGLREQETLAEQLEKEVYRLKLKIYHLVPFSTHMQYIYS